MSDENASILLRGPRGLACLPHINAEMEVIHVTCGIIDVTVGGVTIPAPAGSAVLVMPYQPHSFHPREEAEGRVYMFRFGFLMQRQKRMYAIRLPRFALGVTVDTITRRQATLRFLEAVSWGSRVFPWTVPPKWMML